MSCKELFQGVLKAQQASKMDCPLKIFPKCHRKANFDVFVDAKKKLIVLVCGKCDRTVSTIKIR